MLDIDKKGSSFEGKEKGKLRKIIYIGLGNELVLRERKKERKKIEKNKKLHRYC